MKRYKVVWEDRTSASNATNELAAIWLRSHDKETRAAVNEAANRIDKELGIDALSRGEALSEGLRTLNVPPLRVVFWVDEAKQKVLVESVRLIPTK